MVRRPLITSENNRHVLLINKKIAACFAHAFNVFMLDLMSNLLSEVAAVP